MSGQTPAPAQDFDDEKLRKSIGASQGPEQDQGSAPVNSPRLSKTRPQTHSNVDPKTMDRMKAAYEHDVASGNLAPGARFLKGALETRSGSGSAMAVNDAANSVHDVASSTGGKVVGKAAKSLIGGDPAKLIASGTTVVQAGAQALDQNDPGRNAEYARSKRVYEKSSANRQSAIEALHAEKIKKGDQLTDEQQAHRSETVRSAWQATARNLGKGLKTAALAKATGNSGELLSENKMKHTEGGQTDLAEGEVAKKADVLEGSILGNTKRKLLKGNAQKLSVDRKETLEGLEDHRGRLEGQAKAEKSLRKIGVTDTADLHDDPKDAYSFMDEDAAKKGHNAGIKALNKTKKEELKDRKKSTTFSSHQALHAGEQTQYDASKAEYDSATSEAVALREAHLKKHTDTYQELHKETPKGLSKRLSYVTGAKPLSEEETHRKKHAKAEMMRLGTPHTLENLQGYMSEEQLARAKPHDRTMKNLESVRDTGLSLDQHDTMAAHEAGLADIEDRKKTGLSKSDQAELAQTKRRIALVHESQSEHNETIKENLGKTADAHGRIGGVDRGDSVDPSTYQRTVAGTLAQGAVATAEGLRTGASILGGSDKAGRAALDDRKFGQAALTGTMGVIHEVGGIVAQSTGVPIDTKTAVKPVQGLMHGSADILGSIAGARADKEDKNTVQRELSEGERRTNAAKSPVDWKGSTDHGQAPTDYASMFHAGVSEVDENLTEVSPDYAAGKEKVNDLVSSTTEAAKQSLAEQGNAPAETEGETATSTVPVHEDEKESAEPSVPVHEDEKESAAPDVTVHEDESATAEPDVTVHEDESATAEPENVTGQDEIPAQEAEAPAEKEEEEEWWADKKEKPEADGPTVPTPVVGPDPVHKPKLDLAQVRAAGRKSTAEQAGKHHDPTSQVSDQTKQEYTSPELNQYSWKTMKTSGQRIRRGAQNAWKRTKNFGKRMSGRISRFFGR